MGVPEWLSGMTRNHVGFARAGSNPAAHALLSFFYYVSSFFFPCTPGLYFLRNSEQVNSANHPTLFFLSWIDLYTFAFLTLYSLSINELVSIATIKLNEHNVVMKW